jgi:protein phosphatase 1 regulatory subunit 7
VRIFYSIDLANNKLKKIEGVGALTKLRKIDLGANRIRVMDEKELGGLVNLEELWIGKNKIEEIRGLEKVSKYNTVLTVSVM